MEKHFEKHGKTLRLGKGSLLLLLHWPRQGQRGIGATVREVVITAINLRLEEEVRHMAKELRRARVQAKERAAVGSPVERVTLPPALAEHQMVNRFAMVITTLMSDVGTAVAGSSMCAVRALASTRSMHASLGTRRKPRGRGQISD